MGQAAESALSSKCMPILVIKSHADRWIHLCIHLHAKPRKGCRHPWGAQELSEAILSSRRQKLVLKSNGEPAIVELKKRWSEESGS
eukprot:3403172-Amphidinium_carterae.1